MRHTSGPDGERVHGAYGHMRAMAECVPAELVPVREEKGTCGA